MIPRYGEWKSKYEGQGLTVVGVHAPETDLERDSGRLREFVSAHRIAWPVVLDPDYAVWQRYGVEAWPTVVLVDRAGVIRGAFVGDDQAAAIEAALVRLLAAR